jgi:hypothetical protein
MREAHDEHCICGGGGPFKYSLRLRFLWYKLAAKSTRTHGRTSGVTPTRSSPCQLCMHAVDLRVDPATEDTHPSYHVRIDQASSAAMHRARTLAVSWHASAIILSIMSKVTPLALSPPTVSSAMYSGDWVPMHSCGSSLWTCTALQFIIASPLDMCHHTLVLF